MIGPDAQRHFSAPRESPGKFGLILSFVLLCICVFISKNVLSFVFFDIALVLILVSLIVPTKLIGLQNIFAKLGLFFGRFTGPVFLFLLFYLIVTPTAFLRKCFRRKRTPTLTNFKTAGNEHLEMDYFERPY
jgi:hypothetical protein